MPLVQTLYHTFKHSWQDVFLASWRKYPTPKRPDILSVDIINKEYEPESGVLTTTRLIITEGYLPIWLRPLFGAGDAMFVEECKVDPRNKRMTLYTRNITYDSLLATEEICTYTPDPNNSQWTLFNHSAKVSLFGKALVIGKPVEEFAIRNFESNAKKGRDIMEAATVDVETAKFDVAVHI